MRHRWASLIHEWVEDTGIQIEVSHNGGASWSEFDPLMQKWMEHFHYRVKPKPDMEKLYYFPEGNPEYSIQECKNTLKPCVDSHALRLTFDGETGKLKSAEVLN